MDVISDFISRWLGTALPQLFFLFLGVLLVILVVTALWDRKIKKMGGVLGVLTGLFMASIALEESIARFFSGMEFELRIRLVAILLSLSLLILTLVAWGKTGLQRRYGLTWTSVSLIVLLTAFFPGPLRSFPSLLGVHYGIAVAGLFIVFLLLLVFHLSVSISDLYKKQQVLLERISRLEGGEGVVVTRQEGRSQGGSIEDLGERKGKFDWQSLMTRVLRRPARGTSWGAPLIIFIAVCSVLLVGLSAPQVMVGDEVTHYYMLETQAKVLPQPNFLAEIPTGWGETEVRHYPHSFGWHYLGAIFYKFTGGSFVAIQLYQALFLAQFLGVAYLLARSRGGVQTRAALPYLLILASIPMSLIFSVTFYQGIPMAAQVLTAFYLLRQNRWLLATLFLGFALAMKVTAILFFPAFFICLLIWTAGRCRLKQTVLICCCSLLVISLCTWGLSHSIRVYADSAFYPVKKIEILLRHVQKKMSPQNSPEAIRSVKRPDKLEQPSGKKRQKVNNQANDFRRRAAVIANHPGDLRIKANYVIYGGILLWFLMIAGAAGALLTLLQRTGTDRKQPAQEKKTYWLWGTGLSYTLLVALLLKSSPDARFFLPGLPFLLLPIAEQTIRLPRPKWFISLLASLALLQGGYVLAKTHGLRQVTPELKEAISWLEKNPPAPAKVFMYPEGNYRLFPVPHEWYMNYHLRKFWRADNELRLDILRKFRIGAVVVKKRLVAAVDEKVTNLGVYPNYFVKDLRTDKGIRKVFENSEIVIFQVPGSSISLSSQKEESVLERQ